MRIKQLLRRKRVVIPLIATIAVAVGAGVAVAGMNDNGNVYTGCLTPGGTIVQVDAGDSPLSSCPPNATQISLAGAAVANNDPGLHATVKIDGSLVPQASSGALTSTRVFTGNYQVKFNQDVTNCVATAVAGRNFAHGSVIGFTATFRVDIGLAGNDIVSVRSRLAPSQVLGDTGFFLDVDC